MRPSPPINADTKEFWAAANRRELVYQVCKSCGYVQFYPRARCTKCYHDKLDWRVSTGKGTVYTFTINHRAPNPAFEPMTPYVLALIDMAEGFRIMANVLDIAADQVRIGMPVKIVFEPTENGQLIPQASART
jgi:uncharacterized OB-fold protein